MSAQIHHQNPPSHANSQTPPTVTAASAESAKPAVSAPASPFTVLTSAISAAADAAAEAAAAAGAVSGPSSSSPFVVPTTQLAERQSAAPAPTAPVPPLPPKPPAAASESEPSDFDLDFEEEESERKKRELTRKLNAWKVFFKERHGRAPKLTDLNGDSEAKAFLDQLREISAPRKEQQQQQSKKFEWMDSPELEQLTEETKMILRRNNITLTMVQELEKDDLEDMGIGSFGCRRLLLREIQRRSGVSSPTTGAAAAAAGSPTAANVDDPEIAKLAARFPPRIVYAISEIKLQSDGKLGAGGQGTVRRCLLKPAGESTEVQVAAKSFKDDVSSAVREAEKCLQFREARHVIALKGIVFYRGPLGVECILLYELADCDLDALLKRGIPSWPACVRFAKQIADGIAYLHTRPERTLWLDAKPQNILCLFSGGSVDDAKEGWDGGSVVLKIADLGLAKQPTHAGTTQMSVPMLTPKYAPRSQFSGNVSSRTDCYSFGAVIFWLVTGNEAWDGRSQMEIRTGNLIDHLQPRDGCPARLLEVARRCLNPDESQRPLDGVELVKLFAEPGEKLPQFCEAAAAAGSNFAPAHEVLHFPAAAAAAGAGGSSLPVATDRVDGISMSTGGFSDVNVTE